MKELKQESENSVSADQDWSDEFDLHGFFPYQVRIYYRAVSEAISSVYTKNFGLSVSEWRTMAVLGPHNSLSASQIVAQSSMDKVVVSRAIKGLQAHGLLKRDIDGDDRRRAVLRLTRQGQDVFTKLVPMVKKAEENCLQHLTTQERNTLIALMQRVRISAEGKSPSDPGK